MAYTPHINPQEREIIDLVVEDALAEGLAIAVDGGGEAYDCDFTTDREAITEQIAACETTRLIFSTPEPKPGNMRVAKGWVYFVHGNEPHEVMADLTENALTQKVIARAEAKAREIEDAALGPLVSP